LIMFNRILVSDATKQMTHDGLVYIYLACHTRHHALLYNVAYSLCK